MSNSSNKLFFGSVFSLSRPPDWRHTYFDKGVDLLPKKKQRLQGADKFRDRLFRSSREIDADNGNRIVDTHRHAFGRYLALGSVQAHYNSYLNGDLAEINEGLPALEQKQLMLSLNSWKRKNHLKKVTYSIKEDDATSKHREFRVWNVRELAKLNDPMMVEYVKINSGYGHHCDPDYILAAKELHTNENLSDTAIYIGYCIFCGISDLDIAKRWNFPELLVRTFRQLFYDFSFVPKNYTAAGSYLKQLQTSGKISPDDYNDYKCFMELGELGIKAKLNIYQLDTDEKKKLVEYLGISALENVFKLKQAIKTLDDAHKYQGALGNIHNNQIKSRTCDYLEAKTENMKASTTKMNTSTQETSIDDTTIQLFNGIIHENSLEDPDVLQFKSVVDITAENADPTN